MPIITIVTDEQRAAVAAAAQAARIVRSRIADAALIELAQDDSPIDGVVKYQLLNVWSACQSQWMGRRRDAHMDVVGRPDHDGHHRLSADDVRRVEELLRAAGETEPSLFELGELASGAWHLDMDAVLAAHQG